MGPAQQYLVAMFVLAAASAAVILLWFEMFGARRNKKGRGPWDK